MNKENAKDFLPLVQALANGKTIQGNHKIDGWSDLENVKFDDNNTSNYRVKPEPVKQWYRVAEFSGMGCIIVENADAETTTSRAIRFIRWLTDRIYYTVTDK